MGLNKTTGNMYSFCSHTFNILKGSCINSCKYCYMKRFPQIPIHFDEKELKTDLGKGNTIFVGSSTDMFAEDIKKEWISKVLSYLRKYPDNNYILQTKNPKRYFEFINEFPYSCLFGTTIETSYEEEIKKVSNAPSIAQRKYWMERLKFGKVFITLEPLIDFNLSDLVEIIKEIHPDFVNIGADSNKKKDYSFQEPSKEKIESLIKELEKFTKVNLKDNLKRLL
jgi:DNA repair photolyase